MCYILDNGNDNESDLFSDRDDVHNYMLLKAQYESTMVFVENISSEISRLTNPCKEHKKELHNCDQIEKNIKEETNTLRTQLA